MAAEDVFPRNWREKPNTGFKPGALPVIETPFTRLTESWMTHQGSACRDYEMDYIRCQARVGRLRAETECRKFIEDFMECRWKVKTAKRYKEIKAERKKQGRPLMEAPPKDSIHIPISYN